jgi:hypothetical protein
MKKSPSPQQGKTVIRFRLPQAELEYVQEVAKEMDRATAWLIQRIVRDWVATGSRTVGQKA